MPFNKTYTFDAKREFKDAGLIAASAAAQVDGADKIVDVGSGFWEADLVIDVSAIEVASGDEDYQIGFQVSDSATFASGYHEVMTLHLGDSSVVGGDTDTPAGRYILPVHNSFGGATYRYARVFTRVAGAIATGINYTAWAGVR